MNKISIKPEREYLREIVSKIQSGAYAVPAFQRNFVWKPSQIIELFDSIINGFPIGTLILWKPIQKEEPPVKNIVTEEITTGLIPEYYILDGRQRCTAFYCCVSDIPDKAPCFKLYYNLEKQMFEYSSRNSNMKEMVLVSEVYDTMRMLNLFQQMMQEIEDEKKRISYITQIKELNTVLQSYEVGEIFINKCSLTDSCNVFSRINSKGTDISDVEMIQAVSYKNKNSVLIATEINKLISELDEYGFQDMKADDVLNCCYKYIGKNYYDNNVMKLLMDSNLNEIVPKLKRDVRRAVEFLYNDCNVISYKLLPYNRQLIAIANFFREKQEPTDAELRELKKWFYYTSYQQTFLNGSLGNIRNIFEQFEDFLRGKRKTAINYEEVNANLRLDFKFTTGSALSDFIVMCLVNNIRKQDPDSCLSYNGIYRYKDSKPANSFVLFDNNSKAELSKLIRGREYSLDNDKLLLDCEMIEHIKNDELAKFVAIRKKRIVELISCTLKEMDIPCKNNQETTEHEDVVADMLSDFSDLNNAEKVELCSILSMGIDAHSVIFNLTRNESDATITIDYSSFQQKYTINELEMKKCLKAIENEYCNGEDPESYFNWLLALDIE